MRLIRFLIGGVIFGVILTKSEVISWFRIYEMFRFESFHMYGVIGSALILGILFLQVYKRWNPNNVNGEKTEFKVFEASWVKYIVGGTIFGMGWAMTGACPGPLYILVGNGYSVILVAIASALLGTLTYGVLKKRLPH